MKGAVLWALLALAAGAAVEVDWTALERASLTAGVNETLSFLCSSECSVTAVTSFVSRAPDPQPGAFDVAAAAGAAASVRISTDMAGRTYRLVDRFDASRQAFLIVGGGRSVFVRVAPPLVNLRVDVGVRILFECDGNCSASGPAWIAETNAAGQIIPAAEPPFVFGPLARFYPVTLDTARRFFFVSPTLDGVGGVITAGEPGQLPYRGLDLECRCNFPACGPDPAPCDAPNATGPSEPPSYLPPLPTIAPAQLCDGATSARCPSIAGFGGAAVWGASATRGDDCGNVAGSFADPFASIGRAVCAAGPGDVVVVDVEPGTYHEDMVVWDECVSCVQFALEDSVSMHLGRATLRSGGEVQLWKSRPDWPHGHINLVWTNVHRFSRLQNRTLEPVIN